MWHTQSYAFPISDAVITAVITRPGWAIIFLALLVIV